MCEMNKVEKLTGIYATWHISFDKANYLNDMLNNKYITQHAAYIYILNYSQSLTVKKYIF